MSDLLSPILYLMEDETDAFWCFVGFMEREERNFEMNQQLMKQQLENLAKLVEYIFPEFWQFLGISRIIICSIFKRSRVK